MWSHPCQAHFLEAEGIPPQPDSHDIFPAVTLVLILGVAVMLSWALIQSIYVIHNTPTKSSSIFSWVDDTHRNRTLPWCDFLSMNRPIFPQQHTKTIPFGTTRRLWLQYARFRTGSLVLISKSSAVAAGQKFLTRGQVTHMALLVMCPETPDVPYIFETTNEHGLALRPLTAYLARPDVLVYVRPFRGDSLHEAVLANIRDSVFHEYSLQFNATVVQRVFPVLPFWRFVWDDQKHMFCSEHTVRVLQQLQIIPASINAHDILPVDAEPGRRLDRLCPQQWGPAFRLLPP